MIINETSLCVCKHIRKFHLKNNTYTGIIKCMYGSCECMQFVLFDNVIKKINIIQERIFSETIMNNLIKRENKNLH